MVEVKPAAGPYPADVARERLAFLKTSERWPRARLEAYQLERVRDLLRRVAATVPYYARLFGDSGFDPFAVSTIEDLRRLPFLTKDLVRRHHAELVASDADPNTLRYMTTGGSTGDPLRVIMDERFRGLNHANTLYYMALAGYAPGEVPSVRLHGNTIPAGVIERGEYWVEDGPRLTMSVYHLTAETGAAYVARINAQRPRYIHAFASAAALLCRYIEAGKLEVTAPIECVFCDSETLYRWQREQIARVLGCRIYDTYGHTEGAVIAVSCPASELLHVLPQVGLLELVAPDGSPVTREGAVGEIVVTGFNNAVFPLIRYRTGDLGTFTAASCPCGREYPMLRAVEGRLQDVVVGRSGRPVLIAPALFDYQFDWSNIDRFQIVQERAGALTFRLVPAPDSLEPPAAMARRLVGGFGEILGHEFDIAVEFVDAIPRTMRGKYRYVDQRLGGHVPIG